MEITIGYCLFTLEYSVIYPLISTIIIIYNNNMNILTGLKLQQNYCCFQCLSKERNDKNLIYSFITMNKCCIMNNTRKIPVPRSINGTDVSGLTLHQKSNVHSAILISTLLLVWRATMLARSLCAPG